MYEESIKSKASTSYKSEANICKRSELYQRLEADRVSHYKTAFFETLLRLGNSGVKTKTLKDYFIINYTVLFIRKIQFLSIILLTFENSKKITLESFLNLLFELSRFDVLCSELNIDFIFLVILLASIWGFCLSFCFIYFQIYFKKNVISLPLTLLAKILGWINENILFIPYAFSAMIYTKYTFFSDSAEITEYDNKNSSGYNTYLSILLILGLPVIVLTTFSRTIIYCKPYYTNKIKGNRMYSLIVLKDSSFQLILTILSFYSSNLFFNVLCAIISTYMIFQYYWYLPFIAVFDNSFEASSWALILLGVISHEISIHTNAKSVRALIIFFIYPCIWFILHYFMNQHFNRATDKWDKNPYGIEFKIRQILLNTKSKRLDDSLRSQIKAIFKEATEKFLSFKLLFIWECLFYLRYEKDKSLALMKLSKINFSSCKHLNISKKNDENKKEVYSYPNIEAEYLYYYYYHKLVDEESEKNLILIRYIRDINQLNAKDLEVSTDLWELYTKLVTIFDHSPSTISYFCARLAESKYKYEKHAEKMMKRHHLDPLVLEIYGSYREDLLGDTQGKTLVEQSKNLKGSGCIGADKSSDSKFQGIAVMVVSGMPKNIGDILYLNKEILKLLCIDNADEYLGTSFTQFIPAPFDVMHDDILRRGLIFADRIELYRPNLFLITTRGHCVEVTMHFRVSFFKQTPYFIADFNEKCYNNSKIILYSPEGYIYAASNNIHHILGNRKGSIYEVLNNIAYYFEKYESGIIFDYDEDFSCSMKRAQIIIDGVLLEVLYLMDDDYFAQIKNLGKAAAIDIEEQFNRANNESHITIMPSGTMTSLKLESSMNFIPSLNSDFENNENSNKRIETNSEKVNNFCNSMNMKMRFSIVLLLGIIICILLLEKYLIKELNLSDFISNFATIRSLGLGILIDSRSLDIISHGYNLSSPELSYRTSLKSNIMSLKTALASANSDFSSYSYLTNYLEKSEIITIEKLNTNLFRTTKVNLFQALQRTMQEGSVILNTNSSKFSDIQDSLFYIYWNFPWETFSCINASLYLTIEEIQEHTLSTFEFLKYMKFLAFIPSFLLIAFSIKDIINLEIYNKKNWKSLSSLNIERKITLKENLIDRLYNFHDVQVVDEIKPKRSKKKQIYSFIWKSYIFKILLLEISSIAYYFISIYVLQNQISDALISASDYRFSSGLRRSLTKNTYFWAREQLLDKSNISIITNTLHDGSPFPSIPNKLHSLIDDYKYCQHLINYGPLKKWYNDEMIDLMIGNPCSQLNDTVAKCQTSYVSMGIIPGINVYLNECERLLNYKKTDWKDINKLESFSKLISNSVNMMVNIFMNTTDTRIADTLDELVVTTLLYFFLMLVITILIVFTAVNKMKKDLTDKIEVLKYFEA